MEGGKARKIRGQIGTCICGSPSATVVSGIRLLEVGP